MNFCFEVFWCYKGMTKCVYCCSLAGIFGFRSSSHWTGTFLLLPHLQQTEKPRSNCCWNRIIFSHSYQDWGHILGKSDMRTLTVNQRKPGLCYYHVYLPEPEFIYRLTNTPPSFTVAALKSWKITKLKIDLSLPKYQDILNIFFKPSEAIKGNNCLDTSFTDKVYHVLKTHLFFPTSKILGSRRSHKARFSCFNKYLFSHQVDCLYLIQWHIKPKVTACHRNDWCHI